MVSQLKTLFCAVLFCLPLTADVGPDVFKVEYYPGGSRIMYIADPLQPVCLTEQMPGWHVAPRLIQGEGRNWVVWEIKCDEQAGIGLYDLMQNQAERHMFAGLSDIGQIEVLFEGGHPRDIFFIAQGRYVDLFQFCLTDWRLVNLTDGPEVEHGFALRVEGDLVDVEIERIGSLMIVRYDRLSRTVLSKKKSGRRTESKLSEQSDSWTAAASTVDDYYVSFGDSITAGKMYLPQEGDVAGVNRPTRAYTSQLNALLTADGYQVLSMNRGVNEMTTARGRELIPSVLTGDYISTLIVMLGTNDVWNDKILVSQSLSNIEAIVDSAFDKDMRVLLCTIPPSNDKYAVHGFKNMIDLNDGLRQMAARKACELIDVYGAFMDHDYPEGWVDLLEERNDKITSGCHPNPEGHAVIAALMKARYDDFLLKPPQTVSHTALTSLNGKKVGWQEPNSKFIDHYLFEFGVSAGAYTHQIETDGLEIDFILLQRFFTGSSISGLFEVLQRPGQTPQVVFQRGATVYYRIKTINEKGLESRYSDAGSFTLGGD